MARPTLARLISSRRARYVREHYAAIGGKSPLRELTEQQAAALERELRRAIDARVFVAMRYWHPLTQEAVEQTVRGEFHQLVLLPLYPQYSRTTTGSSLNEWHRRHGTPGHRPIPSTTIHHFYDHPTYLDAVVEKVNDGLARFHPVDVILSPDAVHRHEESQQFEMKKILGGVDRDPTAEMLRSARDDTRRAQDDKGRAQGDDERAQGHSDPSQGDSEWPQDDNPKALSDKHPESVFPLAAQFPQSVSSADDVWLVFSAHGVPVRVIEAGDPYQRQIEETVRLVMERGGWRSPHVLCWQSRVSPGKWLEPSLGETLRDLASQGAQRVLVIPISFVTDHVETLAEINIEARALAHQLGIAQFELMPALNDSPTFIRALADLVLARVEKSQALATQRAQRTENTQSTQR